MIGPDVSYAAVMCQEAPGLQAEKPRMETVGAQFLGIVGDQLHDYGYHLCNPDDADYSTFGSQNDPVCDCACALDVGMSWPASRSWLQWLIGEIRDDRITGIAEVIGSFDGVNVRYWSDTETPDWQQEGVPYQGDGHDTWTHVAIYRSTALEDHRLLAGWTANGLEVHMSDDYGPYGKPDPVEDRTVPVMVADLWGQERDGESPYNMAKTYRTLQLDRIEEKLDAALAKLDSVACCVDKT